MVVGKPERATQNRIITLFREELGYRCLGDWTDREGNSNIEEGLLTAWLKKSGYSIGQINVALPKLRTGKIGTGFYYSKCRPNSQAAVRAQKGLFVQVDRSMTIATV